MKIEKNTGKIIEKTIPECLGTTANLYKLFLVFALYTTTTQHELVIADSQSLQLVFVCGEL